MSHSLSNPDYDKCVYKTNSLRDWQDFWNSTSELEVTVPMDEKTTDFFNEFFNEGAEESSESSEGVTIPGLLEETEVPPPVLWALHEEPMKENVSFTHCVVVPSNKGRSPILHNIFNLYKYEDFRLAFVPGEITWFGPLMVMSALQGNKDVEASADFEGLDICLTQIMKIIYDEWVEDKPIYIDIPYFQAVDENNNRVFWNQTCEYIIGIIEREVNKIRIKENKPFYQIIVGFWDNF